RSPRPRGLRRRETCTRTEAAPTAGGGSLRRRRRRARRRVEAGARLHEDLALRATVVADAAVGEWALIAREGREPGAAEEGQAREAGRGVEQEIDAGEIARRGHVLGHRHVALDRHVDDGGDAARSEGLVARVAVEVAAERAAERGAVQRRRTG